MMLNSTLRSLTAGTAFCALTIWGLTSVMPNNTPTYAPRPEAPAQQPDGAAAIQRALLGDADGNIDWEGLDVLRQKVEQAAAITADAARPPDGAAWRAVGLTSARATRGRSPSHAPAARAGSTSARCAAEARAGGGTAPTRG